MLGGGALQRHPDQGGAQKGVWLSPTSIGESGLVRQSSYSPQESVPLSPANHLRQRELGIYFFAEGVALFNFHIPALYIILLPGTARGELSLSKLQSSHYMAIWQLICQISFCRRRAVVNYRPITHLPVNVCCDAMRAVEGRGQGVPHILSILKCSQGGWEMGKIDKIGDFQRSRYWYYTTNWSYSSKLLCRQSVTHQWSDTIYNKA